LLEEVGQDMAIGLPRHYLQLLYEIGDVLYPVFPHRRLRDIDLRWAWECDAINRLSVFRTFPGIHTPHPPESPENIASSPPYLRPCDLTKCDQCCIFANCYAGGVFDIPPHFNHVLAA
jgi:hypothetical protein